MNGQKARKLRKEIGLKQETSADREFGRPYKIVGKRTVCCDPSSRRARYQQEKSK